MLRTIAMSLLGALAGAGLAYGIYRFLGALDILYVPTKGNMDFTRLMVHIVTIVGGASGGIAGAVAGAVQVIVEAIQKSGMAQEGPSPYAVPARQRF